MSERKVLNKYYPPDFDASKLPRVKRDKNRQFTIRLMAPFNMRCKTCGEYIYRGKKFNARKEDVIGKTYLGIQIYRFYIKCTKCLAEITFLTDPENQDYEMEYGAIRNFECVRLAEKQAETEAKQKKEEEVNNPMKILENRTRDSRREMAVLETLEDLRELNAANAVVDPKVLIEEEEKLKQEIERMEKEEDEEEIRRIFNKNKSTDIVEEVIVEDYKVSKHKLEESNQESETKKVKLEPTEVVEAKPSVLFPKLNKPVAPPVIPTPTIQLTKSNMNMFIKKKSESLTNNKPETIKQENKDTSDKETVNNQAQKPQLKSLIGAYSDSSEEEEHD